MPNKRLAPSPRLAPIWENMDPPPVLTVCLVKFSQQTCEIKEMLDPQVVCPTKIFYVDPPLCSSYPHLNNAVRTKFLHYISLRICLKPVRIKFRNLLVQTWFKIFNHILLLLSSNIGTWSFQKDYDLRIKINDYDTWGNDDYVDTLHTHIHFNYSSIISDQFYYQVELSKYYLSTIR